MEPLRLPRASRVLRSSRCTTIPWSWLSGSLLAAGKPAAARLGCCQAGHPSGVCSQDAVGSPLFPGNPQVLLSCSPTPAGPPRLAFTARWCCSRGSDYESSSHVIISRLNHTASALAVYASCRHFLATTQNSLPGDGQPFPGGIPVYPLSSCGEFWVFPDPPLSLGWSWRDRLPDPLPWDGRGLRKKTEPIFLRLRARRRRVQNRPCRKFNFRKNGVRSKYLILLKKYRPLFWADNVTHTRPGG